MLLGGIFEQLLGILKAEAKITEFRAQILKIQKRMWKQIWVNQSKLEILGNMWYILYHQLKNISNQTKDKAT